MVYTLSYSKVESPILDYCSEVWDYKNSLIDTVQNKAIRISLDVHKFVLINAINGLDSRSWH